MNQPEQLYTLNFRDGTPSVEHLDLTEGLHQIADRFAVHVNRLSTCVDEVGERPRVLVWESEDDANDDLSGEWAVAELVNE